MQATIKRICKSVTQRYAELYIDGKRVISIEDEIKLTEKGYEYINTEKQILNLALRIYRKDPNFEEKMEAAIERSGRMMQEQIDRMTSSESDNFNRIYCD